MTALAADPQSVLNGLTILAAEQQTMNFYMTIGNRFMEPLARATYLEIAQIEEQHVTHYESILDPTLSWFENLVIHQYHECWMYYSFMEDEIDPRVKQLYELHLNMELEHLRVACDMLREIARREPEEILPKSLDRFICFKENKNYVRQVLANQIDLTAKDSEFVPVGELPQEDRYFDYQSKVHGDWVPTEEVIAETLTEAGEEYRLETEGPHPVEGLRPGEQRNGASTDYARVCKAA
jgi:rubrerythrin